MIGSTLEAKITDSRNKSSADEVSESDYSLADEVSAPKNKSRQKLANKVEKTNLPNTLTRNYIDYAAKQIDSNNFRGFNINKTMKKISQKNAHDDSSSCPDEL